MARPITLFTGQWADLSLKDLAPLAKKMGFDGLELACWGDHFDVETAADSKEYCAGRWKILSENGLTAFTISNHLVGQAICDNIDAVDVNFGLEVHPTEMAFDIASAHRALEAVKHHRRFGFNYDPSHLGYQGVDYVKFLREFRDRIYHVHIKDAWWGHGNGDVGVFGGHTNFGDYRRYWDFRSIGHGDVNFEEIIVALNDIGYQGPLSIEWEDIRMDRVHGATESCRSVKSYDFMPSKVAFDSAFDREK